MTTFEPQVSITLQSTPLNTTWCGVEAAEGKDITVYSKFMGVTYLTSLASFLHVSGIALFPGHAFPLPVFDCLQLRPFTTLQFINACSILQAIKTGSGNDLEMIKDISRTRGGESSMRLGGAEDLHTAECST